MVGRLPVRTRLSCVRVQSTHHRLGWWETGVRERIGEPGVDVELSASSDEADYAAVAGVGTSADP